MRHKLGSSFILSLAINTLLFSGSVQAVTTRWSTFKLSINNVGLGVDSSTEKRLFVSLDAGYSKAKPYDAVLKYNRSAEGYTFKIGTNSSSIKNSQSYHFNAIKYGSTLPIFLYKGATLVDKYTLVFTNLPVIQLTSAATIQDLLKVQGTFHLMSGEFKQDTGILDMGVELSGQTSQNYPKKPLGIKLGSPQKWNVSKSYKLLDLRSDANWRLDPSYRDTTFARNQIAHEIFNAIHPNKDTSRPKGKSAIQGRPTEVILNGAYKGIFILEEKVDRSLLDLKAANTKSPNGKIDYTKPENSSVIYKANYADWKSGKGLGVFFPYAAGDIEKNFSLEYPKRTDALRYEPLKKFIDFVISSTDAVFAEQIGGFIDLKSLADWWLLVSATQATDNVDKNFNLVRNADGKFFVAPWDHDASFGLFWDGTADIPSTFFPPVTNNLIIRLTKIPATGFNTILKDRWLVLRSSVFTKDKLLARFKKYNTQLAVGGAKARNTKIWPLSIDPKAIPAVTADPSAGTLTYIGHFLDIRLPAMDTYIDGLPE